MRKLATIRKITNIRPILNADKIEVAEIDGWECVVKVGEFSIGDLVIYIEVDSIVDKNNPYFAFMQERKYRVRTIKLRKQISQGLVCPLSILPKGNYKEGNDVTDILYITKYDQEGEKEQRLLEQQLATRNNRLFKFAYKYKFFNRFFKKHKRSWPKFIKKTDEERIQNMPWICTKEQGTSFSITEKLNGQSATYFLLKQKPKWYSLKPTYLFGVCSRNIHLQKPDNSTYWRIVKQYDIENVLKKIWKLYCPENMEYLILQGEIIGEGIQENPYKIKGIDFYAFNLLFNDLKVNSTDALLTLKEYNIKFVPILNNQFYLNEDVHKTIELSKGISVFGSMLREGIVVRNYGKNISFKIINPEYLLKQE
jgi:hypothetical protein